MLPRLLISLNIVHLKNLGQEKTTLWSRYTETKEKFAEARCRETEKVDGIFPINT